jgi:hypothetical protein
MNGSADIPTIQANIEWYLKENCDGTVHAMNWEAVGDGSLRLLLYRGGKQSALVFTKKELQSYILKGWEQHFQEKLRSVVEDHK